MNNECLASLITVSLKVTKSKNEISESIHFRQIFGCFFFFRAGL